MVNRVTGNEEGITVTAADGREFRLATEDFPKPKNPLDRADVSEQITAMIAGVFPEYDIRCDVFRLEPDVLFLVAMFPEEPPEYWWMR